MKRTRTNARRLPRVLASESLETRTMLAADLPPVADINSSPGSSFANPTYLTAVGNSLFFRGTQASTGTELWVSDGTEAGTKFVKDVWAGSDSGNLRYLANLNGTLFFVAGTTRATLTFSGPLVRSNGSLADGNYVLTILGASIRRASDNLAFDGDSDGIAGGNYVLGDDETDNFFALYGDTNGDRLVGVSEFGEFRSSFGKVPTDVGFNPLFDFDSNGVVGVSDFGEFRSRFGKPKFAW